MVKGIYPTNLTAMGSTLFFVADDGVMEMELWKSDGSATDTALVNRHQPYTRGQLPLPAISQRWETRCSSWPTTACMFELWKSDGTVGGTTLVKDINPNDITDPSFLTAMGSTLYFFAHNGVQGLDLWKSDGTEAGTTLVKDINVTFIGSSYPEELTATGNTLFFVAVDGVHGWEPWKSDGTASGTTLVKHINPNDSSRPWGLTPVGSTLFFVADRRHPRL